MKKYLLILPVFLLFSTSAFGENYSHSEDDYFIGYFFNGDSIQCPNDTIITECLGPIEVFNQFDGWLSSVAYLGSCDSFAITLDPQSPMAPNECGGMVQVIFNLEDTCGVMQSCTAEFKVEIPLVTSTAPSDTTVASCNFPDQAAVDADFAAWVSAQTTAINVGGGCNPQISNDAPGSGPAHCTGGERKVTWTITDLCLGTDIKYTATYTLNDAPAVTSTAPSDTTVASCNFADQAAVDVDFADWVAAQTTAINVGGGCSPNITNDALGSGPMHCSEGSIEVKWTITDLCLSPNITYTATYILEAASSPTLKCPEDITVDPNLSQDELDNAFIDWAKNVTIDGGCSLVLEEYTAPNFNDYCAGNTIEFTFSTQNGICHTSISCMSSFSYPGSNLESEIDEEGPLELCSGSRIELSGNSTSGGSGMYSFRWDKKEKNEVFEGIGDEIDLFEEVNTDSSSTTEIEFRMIITDGIGCSDTSLSSEYTIYPLGHVDQKQDKTFCNQDNVQIDFSSDNPTNQGKSTVFNWTASGGNIGIANSGNDKINSMVHNNNTSTQFTTITVTPTFKANGLHCRGDSMSFDITVRPTPQVELKIDGSPDENDDEKRVFVCQDTDNFNFRIRNLIEDLGVQVNYHHYQASNDEIVIDAMATHSSLVNTSDQALGDFSVQVNSIEYRDGPGCSNSDSLPEALIGYVVKNPEVGFTPENIVLGSQQKYTSTTQYDDESGSNSYIWSFTRDGTHVDVSVSQSGDEITVPTQNNQANYMLKLEVEDIRGCKSEFEQALAIVTECENVDFVLSGPNNSSPCENHPYLILKFAPNTNFGGGGIHIDSALISIEGAIIESVNDEDNWELFGDSSMVRLKDTISTDDTIIDVFELRLIPQSDNVVINATFDSDCVTGSGNPIGQFTLNPSFDIYTKVDLIPQQGILICDDPSRSISATDLIENAGHIDNVNQSMALSSNSSEFFNQSGVNFSPKGTLSNDTIFSIHFENVIDLNSCPVDSDTFTYHLRAVPKIDVSSIVTSFCEGNPAFLYYDSIMVSTDSSIVYLIEIRDSSGNSPTTLSSGDTFNLNRNDQFSWSEHYQLLAIRDDDYSACSTEAIAVTFGSTAIPSYTFDPVETAVCRGQWKQFVMTNDSIAWDSVFIADGSGNGELLFNRSDDGLISFGVRVNDNMGSLSIRLEGVRKDNTGSRDDDCQVNETITLAINNTAPYGEEELPMALIQREEEQMLQLFLPDVGDLLGTYCYRWGRHTKDNPMSIAILQDNSRLPYHLLSEQYNDDYLYFVEVGDSGCNFDCAGRYYLGGTREALSGQRMIVQPIVYGSSPVQLEVFPNPAGSTFQIRAHNATEDYRIEVFDISGRLIHQMPFVEASSLRQGYQMQPDLNNGMYILRLIGKRGDMLHHRLIIQSH